MHIKNELYLQSLQIKQKEYGRKRDKLLKNECHLRDYQKIIENFACKYEFYLKENTKQFTCFRVISRKFSICI